MSNRLIRALALLALILAPALALRQGIAAQVPTASDPPRYVLPPKVIVDAFDAEPLPQTLVSPNKQVIALTRARTYPTIAELAQPMYRLAGARVNPKTNGPHRASGLPGTGIYAITLKKISGGAETAVKMPAQARISNVKFSPDGSRLSFLQTRDDGIELWVADGMTGASKAMVTGADRINATTGDPCDWLQDSVTMLCRLVPAGRGPAPAEPLVPSGPHVEENDGKAAPAPTYEDLLKTAYDDTLFDYYFTSQLAAINVSTGARTMIGKPAVLSTAVPAPAGQYVLVARIKKPFSHTVPMNGFAQDVEIWTRAGEVAKKIADQPSREGTTLTGVEPGPRGYRWRADQPASILWAEALDGGDLKNKVPFRDVVMSLAAPFSGQPVEVARTEWRYAGINYTDAGIALLTEDDRASRRTRTWILEPGAPPRKVWDRKQDAAYDNPGTPVTRHSTGAAAGGGGRGSGTAGSIIQNGDFIYVAGVGASKDGDRPFLDRLNLKTLKSERIFRSSAESLESFVAPLNDEMTRFLTRFETQKDAPNYFSREAGADSRRAVTQFADPQPQVRDILRQYVTYKRNDGVTLSGTLYLPPGYKQGTRVPVILWAYPREFGDADSASQVSGSPNSFTTIRGGSHMFLLLSGYAIFDDPTMPIIGPGETANDTYVEQLIASAQAAVDKIVEMGVADRDRIGVGGHSYGGFMTANLLAHSRLFRAGFAESGAYNRSLTPWGFQSERRSFWEAPDIYTKMSPFWYADKIKDPILLMHGEMDDNTGTFPINSERLYAALKGHGATVRLVMLPNEAHGYAARETLLHVLAERLNWFDKYVKNAGAKNTTNSQAR
ncbi:MAG TPA: prolyl oligopeptidase family serine peptidase [Vicinamibacterales bacterium]|nr:prolyl oligopeptidase family serine peptidase [Vicinamibacterales bacterium]